MATVKRKEYVFKIGNCNLHNPKEMFFQAIPVWGNSLESAWATAIEVCARKGKDWVILDAHSI